MLRNLLLIFTISAILACDEPPPSSTGFFQLVSAQLSGASILNDTPVPVGTEFSLSFSTEIDINSINSINLSAENQSIEIDIELLSTPSIISIKPLTPLKEATNYILTIPSSLIATNGNTFKGIELAFETSSEPLKIIELRSSENVLIDNSRNLEIDIEEGFEITFNTAIEANDLIGNLQIVGNKNYTFEAENISDKKIQIFVNEPSENLEKVNLLFINSLGDSVDKTFETVSYEIFTNSIGEPDFPMISDEELLTKIQQQTFEYFWSFGHPNSGMARERNTSGDIVTSGGTGFGLMSIIVGIERGFISREEGITRFKKIMDFLENADRFHGVWSHWINGNTGKVVPFSQFDNGGDIVETAFLVQGMLTVRQYLNETNPLELELISQINTLWEEVEWDWYAREETDYISWHWSPNYEWQINLPVRGHNETQIIYTLAAASPTHSIDKEYYTSGYQRNGDFVNNNLYYGISLPTGPTLGGPLFFSHYSYLGMDPRNLSDGTINYWEQNINHTLINRAYCIANPLNYAGYSDLSWGLTASDNNEGYSAHAPDNDKGIITPTAAISSIVYTPEESLEAIRFFYYQLGDRLWGDYGFYDAFNLTEGWIASSYLAIDQGPIICMIENHRTELLWNLYMSAPEVLEGLDKLGFTY